MVWRSSCFSIENDSKNLFHYAGMKVTNVHKQDHNTTSKVHNSDSQSNFTNKVAIPENAKDLHRK